MIEKKLKYMSVKYDEEEQEFEVTTWPKWEGDEKNPPFPESIKLNKTYAFSLMRFIVRISQRNWHRKKK